MEPRSLNDFRPEKIHDTHKIGYVIDYRSFSYNFDFSILIFSNTYIFEILKRVKRKIYLASCFNSLLCIDWQRLKSSTASFRISWFARLQDLDHTNNQEFDHKK